MGKLGNNWIEKMADIGWRPNNMDILAHKYLGENDSESIIGVLNSGDIVGSLIGVSTSHVKDTKRIEKTIIRFPEFNNEVQHLRGRERPPR